MVSVETVVWPMRLSRFWCQILLNAAGSIGIDNNKLYVDWCQAKPVINMVMFLAVQVMIVGPAEFGTHVYF